eukprot:CAMPEP_0176425292 /NCGR_PEP_ID=MMETSP0127-20121128/11311_1 /TAXON_ID=938130 /ORGANISM="Platyophrya macrostoma, Strain WH" /LENGTH=492 /DNA_ID=CAMNT_0017806443 /DNA_START=228 /DNA_END=1703 /DNA_ORIENTATION=-
MMSLNASSRGGSTLWQPQQPSVAFVNPTLAPVYTNGSASSFGYGAVPQAPVSSSSSVKRHNPYAPVPVGPASSSASQQMYHEEPQTHQPPTGYEMFMVNSVGLPMLNTMNGTSGETSSFYSGGMMSEGGSFDGSSTAMLGNGRYQGSVAGAGASHLQPQQPISHEELLTHQGTLVELSRTAPGSSFIQAALRDDTPFTQQNVALISSELLPAASSLLLDAHGCYVIKTLMERLPTDSLKTFVTGITSDQELVFSMCTHSLHTRRVVQYVMDTVDVLSVAEVLIQRCPEVSRTQQGCIIMQRAMDITPEPLRAQLFSTIFDHLMEFSVDPFANYVVQHMLEIGDKDLCSSAVLRAFRGNIVRLACNKFASNVMEKSLFHITPEAQHDLIVEMYDVDEEVLHSMMQDSFGNYLIQSSIALATLKDVMYINDRLKSVLQRTPYGHKIELRIERRLKGRPVGTRSAQIGANSKSSRQQRAANGPRDICSEPMEEPW